MFNFSTKLKNFFLPRRRAVSYYRDFPINLTDFCYMLSILYEETVGYVTELSRDDQTLPQQGIFLTYGELLPIGVCKLFDAINPTSADSFVDLGSGTGKIVLQSYLCTSIKKSYGVEVDGARHKAAIKAYNLMIEQFGDALKLIPPRKTIDFFYGNIVNFDLSKVTIVLADSTCFGDNLLAEIIKKINDAPNIRAVITLKQMPGLTYLKTMQQVPVETSWHVPPDTSNCYIYTP